MKNKQASGVGVYVWSGECGRTRGGERNKKVIINTVNNYSRRERVLGTESIHQPESGGGDGRNVFFFVTPSVTRSHRRRLAGLVTTPRAQKPSGNDDTPRRRCRRRLSITRWRRRRDNNIKAATARREPFKNFRPAINHATD